MTDTPRPPDTPLEALAAKLDREPELEARLRREVIASMQAFGLTFRREAGRPMTAREWALAAWAHAFGHTDGVQFGFDIAEESLRAARSEPS